MSLQVSRKFRLLSFIFIVIIIIYHSQLTSVTMRNLEKSIAGFYSYLACIAMSYFFMTFGYMLCQKATITTSREKIRRRVFSLLVPFIIWNVIGMFKEFILHHELFHKSVFELAYQFCFDPFNGPLWYMIAIFMLSFFIFPIVKLKMKCPRAIYVVFAMIVGVSFLVYSFDILKLFGLTESMHFVMWITRLMRYLPSYFVGCLFGVFSIKSIDYSFDRWIKLFVTMIIVGTSLLWLMFSECPKIILQIILTLQPVLIWLLIDNQFFQCELPHWIKGSFLMYAIHFLIISFIRSAINRFLFGYIMEGNRGLALRLLFPYLCVLVVYCVSSLLQYLFRITKMDRIERILSGNRNYIPWRISRGEV